MVVLRAGVRADRSPDRVTARTTAGVRIAPGHWASRMVHSFRRWSAADVVETWCELTVDVRTGGALTTQTIDCLACGENSWRAIRRAIG